MFMFLMLSLLLDFYHYCFSLHFTNVQPTHIKKFFYAYQTTVRVQLVNTPDSKSTYWSNHSSHVSGVVIMNT